MFLKKIHTQNEQIENNNKYTQINLQQIETHKNNQVHEQKGKMQRYIHKQPPIILGPLLDHLLPGLHLDPLLGPLLDPLLGPLLGPLLDPLHRL